MAFIVTSGYLCDCTIEYDKSQKLNNNNCCNILAEPLTSCQNTILGVGRLTLLLLLLFICIAYNYSQGLLIDDFNDVKSNKNVFSHS